jgi:6,7-dimethyl-8-ribityllumazine synthase
MTLYQTVRYGATTYRFSVPNNTYAVNLKFAEIISTSQGKRVFDVVINDQAALSEFDIVAQAGRQYTAVDKEFSVPVTNGQITIQLIPVVENPSINAIEIQLQDHVVVSLRPCSTTLTASRAQQFAATVTGSSNKAVVWSLNPALGSISPSGLYVAPLSISSPQLVNVTATSVADPTKFASATVSLLPSGSFTPIRVNAGGWTYIDSSNRTWSADTGSSRNHNYSNNVSIANTTDPALYQTVRVGETTYRYSVANNTYAVNLKFAEILFTSAGKRVFNVVINGQTVLSNFDVVAQAGGAYIAVDKNFSVPVTNGRITIGLSSGIERPIISAIRILAAGP